jgi:hypothetical protein
LTRAEILPLKRRLVSARSVLIGWRPETIYDPRHGLADIGIEQARNLPGVHG